MECAVTHSGGSDGIALLNCQVSGSGWRRECGVDASQRIIVAATLRHKPTGRKFISVIPLHGSPKHPSCTCGMVRQRIVCMESYPRIPE